MRKTLALVVRKQNIGETDRILTLISPLLGKKRVVAKAVRRPLSKLAGHLDTYMLSQVIITDKNELPTITNAQLVESFAQLRNSTVLLHRTGRVVSLIERVTLEDISQQTLFSLLIDTIARINAGYKWESNWLFFLSRLASELAIIPKTPRCAVCDQPLQTGYYSERDGFMCTSHASTGTELKERELKLFRLLGTKPYQFINSIAIPGYTARVIEKIFLIEITKEINKPWEWYACLD